MQALLDVLPEPLLLLNAAGTVVHANRTALQLLGVGNGVAAGQPLAALLADAPAQLQALLRQGLRSTAFSPGRVHTRAPLGQGASLRCELARVAASQDHAALVLLRLTPNAVSSSRFLALNERIAALSHEVQRRRQAEDALRRQSEWLEAVLRSIGDAVIATDARGHVVFMNRVAETLCACTAAQATGQPVAAVFTIIDSATRLAAPCPVALALQQRRIVGVKPGTVLLAHDGQEHPVDDAAGPIIASDGQLHGVVLVFREISVRLQAESDRQRHEQQLRDAQRMHAVGTLAGGIAHDFNNVLGAILGNVRLATDALDPAHPATQRLELIDLAGRRARDLVRQIMAFSRREPHRLVPQPVQPLVEECGKLLRSTLPSSVQLDVHCEAPPLVVQADSSQLSQVIMNLGTNAWHALRGSSGTISVSVGLYDGSRPPDLAPGLDQWTAGRYARIAVADTGAGIEPGVLAHIFEPFFTTKQMGEGTGLGLSVVHGIVAAHGGLLTVHSRLQQGSCFALLLPLTDAPADLLTDAPADLLTDAPPATSAARSPVAAASRVMYVDDDDVLVLTTAQLLLRDGHQVTTFADGAAALASLRAAAAAVFDVIVTDYNMPGLDGLSLAVEVRSLLPTVPLILTSGYFPDDVVVRARTLGGVWLLQKEESFERLPGLIGEALAWRNTAAVRAV